MPTEASVVIQPVIDECARCMALRWKKFKLKRHLSGILYGFTECEPEDTIDSNIGLPGAVEVRTIVFKPLKIISEKSYETIRKKAREQMAERASITQNDARLDSIGLYEQIIEDESVHANTRMKAQQNLDMILKVNEANQTGGIEQTAEAAIAALAMLGNVMAKKGPDDEQPSS